jgi:two-component system, OmpR family, phosphate regulon response regulator PhoB
MTDALPLVVVGEDDEDILLLVQATLSGAGYEVALARDGAAALALVQDRRPAAVVLDIAMPGLDGLEVLTRARAEPSTAELPIVLLSARAQESDVARGYELGASRYIRKPFSPRELVAAVDELVSGQAAPGT